MSRRWALLALVFLGILISYIDRGNLSIAATSMMRDFHLAPESMGVLLSGFFWTYAIFQLPAGVALDKFGIRFLYGGAFLLWSLASAAIALSRGPADVFGLRLVLGLAESVGPIASMAFIRQNFKASGQGLPVSVYIAGQTIGPACGALLGAALLTDFGWRTLFAVTGLGALLWVPAWLWLARSQNSESKQESITPGPSVRWPWRIIVSSASFWALSACIFFISYYWYFLLTWMPAYLTMDRGFSTLGMGKIFSTPLFAMAGINLLAGFLADRLIGSGRHVFKVRLSFLSAGLLGASSILLLNLLPGRAPVLPVLVLSICSFGLASSNFWAVAQYTAPQNGVGRAIGYLNTVSQIAGVLAPIITGRSLGVHHHFEPAIWIAGLCPLFSVMLLALAGPGRLGVLKQELSGSLLFSEVGE